MTAAFAKGDRVKVRGGIFDGQVGRVIDAGDTIVSVQLDSHAICTLPSTAIVAALAGKQP